MRFFKFTTTVLNAKGSVWTGTEVLRAATKERAIEDRKAEAARFGCQLTGYVFICEVSAPREEEAFCAFGM